MAKYAEQFSLFDLPTTLPQDYKNAEQFARTFKRCSIQINESVTYSSDSATNLNKETISIDKSRDVVEL